MTFQITTARERRFDLRRRAPGARLFLLAPRPRAPAARQALTRAWSLDAAGRLTARWSLDRPVADAPALQRAA